MNYDDKNFYKTCFNSLLEGICIADLEGKILTINESFKELFGYQINELKNNHFTVLIPDKYQELYLKYFDHYVEQNRLLRKGKGIDLFGLHKNGTIIPIEISLNFMNYNDSVLTKISVNGISKRKFKENIIIKQNEELKTQISHLNNNLKVAISNLKDSNQYILHEIYNQHTPHLTFNQILKDKTPIKYKKGQSIYCQGNSSSQLFYIVKGEVKTYKNNDDGKEFITGIHQENEMIGISSFSNNHVYVENATTTKVSELIKISKSEILELIKTDSTLALSFMGLLANHLDLVKNHLIHLAYDSVRKKTADALIFLNEINQDKSFEISRIDLANLIGIAKETLIRTLKEFKDEKLIKSNRNYIQILNKKSLQKVK